MGARMQAAEKKKYWACVRHAVVLSLRREGLVRRDSSPLKRLLPRSLSSTKITDEQRRKLPKLRQAVQQSLALPRLMNRPLECAASTSCSPPVKLPSSAALHYISPRQPSFHIGLPRGPCRREKPSTSSGADDLATTTIYRIDPVGLGCA